MSFINNQKFKEIRKAAKEGNEKAKMILQAMRKMQGQDDIDRLVNDYYSVPTQEEPSETEAPQPESDDILPPEEAPSSEPEISEPVNEIDKAVETPAVDLTSSLDSELDGVIDEDEIDDTSFSDFLSNKQKDKNRAKKNSDYFKIYDQAGREEYLNNKIAKYKGKFNNRLRDIERRYTDMDQSISNYSQSVNDMLDDDLELNSDNVDKAYNDLTGDESVMHSFGRYWDNGDNEAVIACLKDLIAKYGKKNVIAALNYLKNDNEGYRDYLNHQVDTEIERYSKSLEKLLK